MGNLLITGDFQLIIPIGLFFNLDPMVQLVLLLSATIQFMNRFTFRD